MEPKALTRRGGFEAGQCTARRPRQCVTMAKLIFRCVQTGMNVQVWLPEAAPTDRTDSYESVPCPACTRLHLVNKNTGRILGDKEEK
jgi:hypothetical protein